MEESPVVGLSDEFLLKITVKGRLFVCRAPDPEDAAEQLDGYPPILPIGDGPEPVGLQTKAESLRNNVRRTNAFLLRVVVSPPLSALPILECPPDRLAVSALPWPIREALAIELMRAAGWSKEAAEEISPLSVAGTPS